MLRKVVRPDKSAVIFKYDALGRRIEKCITRAGSEKVISFAEKAASMAEKASLAEESWEKIGGVRIHRPNTEQQKPHVVQGYNQSIYEGEVSASANVQKQSHTVEKVIRFLWDGNTILHEWAEDTNSSKKPHQKIDYQADYVVKFSEKKKQEAKERTDKGEAVPESLVTWIFQDDFIPRAKITKDGCYSIMTDYLGTPVGAYDEAGNLVWERELDINGKAMPAGKDSYGRTKKEIGEKTFIPFRFQGQYEDEETGLYYNCFRYYDPQTGQYTQLDPIGLAGGNPTLYGYVYDTLNEVDPFGLKNIYRGMIQCGNGPQIGETARTLGVRANVDIPIDGNGMVHPGTGGMSVSPRPEDLPTHRRPIEFGGTGKDPVWKIQTRDLGPDLKYVPDAPGHGTVQPTRSMLFEEYQEALANTQKDWKKVCH